MARKSKLHFDSDGDNTAQALKTSGGYIKWLFIENPNLSDAWIQFFDLATGDVTVGTTTPRQSYRIAAGGVFEEEYDDNDFNFEVAITYACSTTAAGNGDPATGLVVNARYR